MKVQKFLLCPFHRNPSQISRLFTVSGTSNIPQVPRNRAEVCQNDDARKAVSATLLVLKWRGSIFQPTISKVSVQKVMLCPFYCKATPSGSSLQCPELENIPQVPRNRAEVCQNNDSRKAVSATLSVLKWSGALFRPRNSKASAAKNLLCPFHCKPRPSGVSLESPGLQYISQVPENREDVGQNHHARKTVLARV